MQIFHHNKISVIQLYHKTLQGNVYIELIVLWNFRTETSARLPLITISEMKPWWGVRILPSKRLQPLETTMFPGQKYPSLPTNPLRYKLTIPQSSFLIPTLIPNFRCLRKANLAFLLNQDMIWLNFCLILSQNIPKLPLHSWEVLNAVEVLSWPCLIPLESPALYL